MKGSKRLESIPCYMFSNLDNLKNSLVKKGYDIIDLSVGDPDLPTPNFIIKALQDGADDLRNHRYPPYKGTAEFRNAVANYYKRRFGVCLDPECEVIALIGSKEGIAHLSLALIDDKDIALVPDPSYPVYKSSVSIAGGYPYAMELRAENSFLPDINGIDEETAKKTKIVFLNYPNNPTGAVCTLDFYKKSVEFASRHGIAIANDAAYNEIVFNGEVSSILQVPEAMDTAIEFGTLSKSYSMTGWRIGYAVGCRKLIKLLLYLKENLDSGVFGAVQHAGSVALEQGDGYIEYLRTVYKRRKDAVSCMLDEAGISFIEPMGSFYIWFKVPEKFTSYEYALNLTNECGVLVTPGAAFGKNGEGYCRLSLTNSENELEKALFRIKQFHKKIK